MLDISPQIQEESPKFDYGKPILGTVLSDFGDALEAVGEVGTYGARKYSVGGWLTVSNGYTRYWNALFRHLFASLREEFDSESNLPHLAHAAWNALAILQLALNRKKRHREQSGAN